MIAQMAFRWKVMENTGWVDVGHCMTALKGIDSWISTLKKVHGGLLEDVEYLVGKDELRQLLRQLIGG